MKLEAKKVEAVTVTVRVEKDYALALNAIFNNWRDDRRILSVSNNRGNSIFVTVTKESEKDTVEWLEQFGRTSLTRNVLALVVSDDIDWDMDKYEDCVVAIQ